MATTYDTEFKTLLEEIRPYSVQTATQLEQIVETFGVRAAFYAAFIIVCLEARVQERGYTAIRDLTAQDVSNFTYFDYTQHSPQAYNDFSSVLEGYKMDCLGRFERGGASAAAV